MPRTLDIAIVGAQPGLTARLPEILRRPGVSITAIGLPDSAFRRSAFVDRFIPIGSADDPAGFGRALIAAPDVLAALPEWTIVSSDDLMAELAHSALPLEITLTMLPARAEVGLKMLGSKVGQFEVCDTAGARMPRTRVARSGDELAADVAGWTSPVFVKADAGGGGGALRVVRSRPQGWARSIPEEWFPVIVQEAVEGQEVSVEALFRQGRLVGWLYSEVIDGVRRFGPSRVRRYCDPPSLDFVEALQLVGTMAGLHGFASTAFIRSPGVPEHLLFEVDCRPNVWHQHGPRLGVDWAALMSAPAPPAEPVRPHLGSRGGTIVHMYPRDLQYALYLRPWSALRPWVERRPGTWDVRNRADQAINEIEDASLRPRRALVDIWLPSVWVHVPSGLRPRLETPTVRRAVRRVLGIR